MLDNIYTKSQNVISETKTSDKLIILWRFHIFARFGQTSLQKLQTLSSTIQHIFESHVSNRKAGVGTLLTVSQENMVSGISWLIGH